jgi:hypothetical protein
MWNESLLLVICDIDRGGFLWRESSYILTLRTWRSNPMPTFTSTVYCGCQTSLLKPSLVDLQLLVVWSETKHFVDLHQHRTKHSASHHPSWTVSSSSYWLQTPTPGHPPASVQHTEVPSPGAMSFQQFQLIAPFANLSSSYWISLTETPMPSANGIFHLHQHYFLFIYILHNTPHPINKQVLPENKSSDDPICSDPTSFLSIVIDEVSRQLQICRDDRRWDYDRIYETKRSGFRWKNHRLDRVLFLLFYLLGSLHWIIYNGTLQGGGGDEVHYLHVDSQTQQTKLKLIIDFVLVLRIVIWVWQFPIT